MRALLRFLKTTLVGGILFLVPIIAVVIVISKALALAHKLVDPLAGHLPVESVIGLETPVLLAIALLVLFCFLAGLFARTALARRGIHRLESSALSNVPGYEFFKSVGESMLGVESQRVLPVVPARFDDAWQLAFLVERLADGHVAVFVPGAPNPHSGAVHFMTEDRIKPTDIPPTAALKCLKHLGVGSNELLRGLVIETTPAK